MSNPRVTIFPKKLIALVVFLCALMIAGELYATSRSAQRNPTIIPGLAFVPVVAWMALNHMASLFVDLQSQIRESQKDRVRRPKPEEGRE
jgi:hypothetical protein